MDGPDAIDSNKYQQLGRVHKLQHTERDKRRNFTKDLKEKFEEDQEKKRKRSQQDSLILHEIEDDDNSTDTNSETPSRESRAESDSSDGKDASEETRKVSDGKHVDLKA